MGAVLRAPPAASPCALATFRPAHLGVGQHHGPLHQLGEEQVLQPGAGAVHPPQRRQPGPHGLCGAGRRVRHATLGAARPEGVARKQGRVASSTRRVAPRAAAQVKWGWRGTASRAAPDLAPVAQAPRKTWMLVPAGISHAQAACNEQGARTWMSVRVAALAPTPQLSSTLTPASCSALRPSNSCEAQDLAGWIRSRPAVRVREGQVNTAKRRARHLASPRACVPQPPPRRRRAACQARRAPGCPWLKRPAA